MFTFLNMRYKPIFHKKVTKNMRVHSIYKSLAVLKYIKYLDSILQCHQLGRHDYQMHSVVCTEHQDITLVLSFKIVSRVVWSSSHTSVFHSPLSDSL